MKKAILVLLILLIAGSVSQAIDLKKALEGLKKVHDTLRPISEEEEYFIGRAVAARILSSYPLFKDEIMTKYINLIGQVLVIHSQRPEIYAGYHFAILDSNEINALSAPGGIILLTRGLIAITQNEEELAAVLAHEISHVVRRDPIKAVKSERMKSLGIYSAQELTSGSSEVMRLFNDTVLDITGTLLQKGYSRGQEKEADLSALDMVAQAGYDPRALLSMLNKMGDYEKKKAQVFSAHPSAKKRIDYVEDRLNDMKIEVNTDLRLSRFKLIREKSRI